MSLCHTSAEIYSSLTRCFYDVVRNGSQDDIRRRHQAYINKYINELLKIYCVIVSVYEIPSGKALAAFRGHLKIVYDLCWSRDDRRLLSASSDGTVR